jgi:hypothetical protein
VRRRPLQQQGRGSSACPGDKGWFERKGDGFIVATMKAKQDLEPLTLTSIKYVARMMSLMEDADAPQSHGRHRHFP